MNKKPIITSHCDHCMNGFSLAILKIVGLVNVHLVVLNIKFKKVGIYHEKEYFS